MNIVLLGIAKERLSLARKDLEQARFYKSNGDDRARIYANIVSRVRGGWTLKREAERQAAFWTSRYAWALGEALQHHEEFRAIMQVARG